MALEVYDVAVIGAGIAGSTLAALLAPHVRTILIDRDVHAIPGSTGHAPGVVAQINAEPALTELARRSVSYYRGVPNGFNVTGGLEVAIGPSETPATLEARHALASARGLRADILTADQAHALAPNYVRKDANGAIYFPSDGIANAKGVTAHNHTIVASNGSLVNGDVTRIQRCAQGYCLSLQDGRTIKATHVALCTGVWAGQLIPNLSTKAVSVAHPYSMSQRRPPRQGKMSPFVRFPGQTSYCRDHGDRDGFGSYKHEPVHCKLATTVKYTHAYAKYDEHFTTALKRELRILPDETAALFPSYEEVPASADNEVVKDIAAKDVPYAFAGLMTMTPDGMPLAGKLDHGLEGALWCVVGTWVTHAAGTAAVVAPMILNELGQARAPIDDHWLRRAIDPLRFRGRSEEQNEEDCLDKYRDIWNRKVQNKVMGEVRTRAKL